MRCCALCGQTLPEKIGADRWLRVLRPWDQRRGSRGVHTYWRWRIEDCVLIEADGKEVFVTSASGQRAELTSDDARYRYSVVGVVEDLALADEFIRVSRRAWARIDAIEGFDHREHTDGAYGRLHLVGGARVGVSRRYRHKDARLHQIMRIQPGRRRRAIEKPSLAGVPPGLRAGGSFSEAA